MIRLASVLVVAAAALAVCAVPAFSAQPLVSVDDGTSRYSLLDGAVDELGGELSSGDGELAPTFDGGLRVDWPDAEPARSDEGFARPGEMQSVTTAGVAGDWTEIVFAEGVIRFRLVGRPEAEIASVDRAGNAVVFEDVEGVLGEHVIVVGDGVVEEFVHTAVHDGIGFAQYSWAVDLPAGWRLDQGPDRIYILDDELTVVMEVMAPAAQDSTGQVLGQLLSSDSDSITVLVDESEAVGGYLIDPSWHQTSTYPQFSRKYCADGAAGSCDVTSSGQPAGWSESGNTVKYNSNHTPGYGPYVGARATVIDDGYWERYTYNPPSGLRLKGMAWDFHAQIPSGKFKCRSAAYNGVTTAWEYGGWKSHSSSQQSMSIWPGDDWFTQQGFVMQNTSGANFTPGTADANRCYHKESSNDTSTHLLSDTVDPSVSVAAGSWTGSVDWYKNGDQIVVTKTADDDGSGIESFDLQIDGPQPGSYTKTGIQTCNPSANGARPCPLSNDSPHTLTLNNTVAQAGMPNKMRWYVHDYSGRDKTGSYSSTGFGYDNKKPPAPVWVSDGAGDEDVDGIDSLSQMKASWSKVKDPALAGGEPGSGIRKYEYCIATGTSSAGCVSGVKKSWTSTGTATSVTASGLSLSDGPTYKVCVRVYDKADAAGGNGNMSTAATCSDGVVYDAAAPDAPIAVRDGMDDQADTDGLPESDMAAVDWTMTSEDGVAGYEVCLSASSSGSDCASSAVVPWEQAEDQPATMYSETDFSEETPYYSCVRAYDDAGNYSAKTCSDGAIYEEDPPANISEVRDGDGGSDVDFLMAEGLKANWDAPQDAAPSSGIARYTVCITAEYDGADCQNEDEESDEEPGALVPWFENATTSYADADDYPIGDVIYTCVLAFDAAENVSAEPTCSDGVELVAVQDGDQDEDLDWMVSTSEWPIEWSSRLSPSEGAPVASYEYCVTEDDAGADCATEAEVIWTSAGTDIEAVAIGTYIEGTEYFSCVRSLDAQQQPVETACSDGATVDETPPTSPTGVVDGDDLGQDADSTPDSVSTAATWSPGEDSLSGVSGYEICVIPSTQTCQTTEWVYETDDVWIPISHAFELGLAHKVCVRSIDEAGWRSAPACSDGFAVTPSSDEIDHAQEIRDDFGLDAGLEATTDSYLDPPVGWEDELGIPMSSTEAANVDQSLEVVETLLEEVDEYFEEVDLEADPLVEVDYESASVDVVMPGAHEHETELENYVTYPAALDIREGADPSIELEAAAAQIEPELGAMREQGAAILGVNIDTDQERVVVGVENPDQQIASGATLKAAIEQDLDPSLDEVTLSVEEGILAEPVESEYADKYLKKFSGFPKNRRNFEVGRWNAGAAYVPLTSMLHLSTNPCTSNVTLKRKGKQKYYIITAAHCVRDWTRSHVVVQKFKKGKMRKKLVSSRARLLTSMRSWDAAILGINKAWRSNKIFVKPGVKPTVANPFPGKNKSGRYKKIPIPKDPEKRVYVCQTGTMSTVIFSVRDGTICGRVNEAERYGTVSITDWPNITRRYWAKFRGCGGDSGGIVYLPKNRRVIGITHATKTRWLKQIPWKPEGSNVHCGKPTAFIAIGDVLNVFIDRGKELNVYTG